MRDDFDSLFAFNRWANAKMLDACRQLTPEQYAAEPAPGWTPVRFTVYHLAVVTASWLKSLAADDPNPWFVPESEVDSPDAAAKVLAGADESFESLRPKLTTEFLSAVRPFQRRTGKFSLPRWAVLRHIVNHTTYHRGQIASKLKRFGVVQPETDFVLWIREQIPQPAS